MTLLNCQFSLTVVPHDGRPRQPADSCAARKAGLPYGRLTAVLLHALLATGVRADDWPQWRGSNHNGLSAEANWEARWPGGAPRQLWKVSVGIGFSSVAVSKRRVFTMGNVNGFDTVHCLDAITGRVIWQHRYECALDPRYYEGGPGATPTVAEGCVYTLSKKGQVFCLDLKSGKVIWAKDVVKELNLTLPEWSFAGSPLIEENLVILNVGGAGTALDRRTGRVVWTSSSEPAGYATPVPFVWKGVRAVAVFSAKALVAVEARTGRELWRFQWESSRDVNAADPLISGDKLFLSSTTGALLLDLGGEMPVPRWRNKRMRNYFNPCVLVDGHLYGFDGTTHRPTRLVCLELTTGNERWAAEGFGSGGLIAAGGHLVMLDRGELIIAKASPDRFECVSRAPVIGGKCWTSPVLANGLAYCRNAAGDLICLDLRTNPPSPPGSSN